jgi:hypothetical protein
VRLNRDVLAEMFGYRSMVKCRKVRHRYTHIEKTTNPNNHIRSSGEKQGEINEKYVLFKMQILQII